MRQTRWKSQVEAAECGPDLPVVASLILVEIDTRTSVPHWPCRSVQVCVCKCVQDSFLEE